MTNTPQFPWRVEENTKEAELLIIEVAARLQLSPTQVQQAEQNYHALADYIDAPKSPLEDHIETVHASGSFAIGAPIMGKSQETQHDVDAVLELIGFKDADSESILKLVEEALLRPDSNGKSRYEGMIERNSRCVTVTYHDGRTVDLMPVHHITDKNSYKKKLFHFKEARSYKPEESYRKNVAPRGFKKWYLDQEKCLSGPPLVLQKHFIETRESAFEKRHILLEKAETEEFPEQKSLPEKTARTLAIQLLKRNRDIQYERLSGRKPPSVLLATLGMQSSGSMQPLLIDELINVAKHIRNTLTANVRAGSKLHVTNPWWHQDVISDRWNSTEDQNLYLDQLTGLINDMEALKVEPRLSERKRILVRNFGENVTVSVLKSLEEQRSQQRKQGATRVTSTGSIVATTPSLVRAETKKTPFGG